MGIDALQGGMRLRRWRGIIWGLRLWLRYALPIRHSSRVEEEGDGEQKGRIAEQGREHDADERIDLGGVL